MKKFLKILCAILAVVIVFSAFELYFPPVIKISSITQVDNKSAVQLFFGGNFSASKIVDDLNPQKLWCLEKMKSDCIDDYGIYVIKATAKNLSFFNYVGKKFFISSAKKYSENIICVIGTHSTDVQALTKCSVVATVFMYTKDLEQSQILEALLGLTLKTENGSRTVFGFNVPSNRLVFRMSTSNINKIS